MRSTPAPFQIHTVPPPAASVEDVAPSAPAKTSLLSAMKPGNRSLNLQELSAFERFFVAVRQTVDDGVAFVGAQLESKLSFGNPTTRGYAGLIVPLIVIGGLGALFGQQRNVDRPNDGPSFSFSSVIGRFAIIAAAFFACAWIRDLAKANIGDAAILAILLVSILFAVFSATTVFSRSN